MDTDRHRIDVEEDRVACDAKGGTDDHDQEAFVVLVGDDVSHGVDNGTPDIDGDDEILGLLCRLVESVLQDDWQESAEAVKDGDDGDLTNTV